MKRTGPQTLYANETGNTVWLRSGGQPIGPGNNAITVQVEPVGTWTTATYKLVGRTHLNGQPIDIPNASTITTSAREIVQADITSFYDVGLKLVTAEGSTLELTAYASIGD